MTTFDEREQAFETQFKHEQELRFKTNARRNKLVGLWAASRMGMAAADAETYAAAVVAAAVGSRGGESVREKLLKDLTAKGISTTDADVQREMERLLAVAKEQIVKGI